MLENSTQGLTLLDAARTVVVTGVEHHQPALAAWAPLADGRPRQVAAELCPAPVTHGPDTGRCGMDVLLDGWQVGRLPLTVAERYAPYLDDITPAGARPAAVGIVARGPHGLEMELQLPDLAVATEATTALSHVAPAWPAEGPGPRNRTPYLIGAGVLALLVVVAMAVGGRSGEEEPSVASAPTIAPRTNAPEITLPVPTAAPAPTGAFREAADPAPTRAPRSREQAPPPAAPAEPPAQQLVVPAEGPETTAPTGTPTPTTSRNPGGLLGDDRDDEPEPPECPEGAAPVDCTPT
ncbi:hypothetical protein ACVGOW_04895 [Pseudonocardia saturnea]